MKHNRNGWTGKFQAERSEGQGLDPRLLLYLLYFLQTLVDLLQVLEALPF